MRNKITIFINYELSCTCLICYLNLMIGAHTLLISNIESRKLSVGKQKS